MILSYLAGCLDCDGWFTIKRSTYAMRVTKDAGQPVYSERIGLKQVTPEVVDLLHEYFGGYRRIEKPSAKNGKPLYAWSVSDRNAIICAEAVLPYLKVKAKQAHLLVELRVIKGQARVQSGTYEMVNRWGSSVTMPRRIVSADAIAAKEKLFNEIKSLNDSRPTHPVLV